MSNIRDQIAAKRAEARKVAPASARAGAASTQGRSTTGAGDRGARGYAASNEQLEERSAENSIKRARKNGKLDISSLGLDRIPSEVYTDLLGIPPDQLSRPADNVASEGSTDRFKGLTTSFSRQLDIRDGASREDVFGSKGKRKEEWTEPEAELVLFRAEGNRITEIEREIGAFGGLKSIDLSSNQISSLPDSFADLLRLTSINLSDNSLTAIPSQVLLLPALEFLNLSSNAITSIDLSHPVEPSDDGLAYGAGFLSTSFSRAAKKSGKTIFPALSSLNLGHNRLSVPRLAGLKAAAPFRNLRSVNLERNALDGVLDLGDVGLDDSSAAALTALNLDGNARLEDVIGKPSKDCSVSRDTTTSDFLAPSNHSNAPPSNTPATSSSPVTKLPAASGSTPQPDMTLVYRTLPAATFDSLPLDVDLDLYLPPEGSASDKAHPLVIWFHGGGLLQGNKENLPPHFRRLPKHAFASSGESPVSVAVISPNYRLAPQVPIIDILSDVTALLSFVRTKLNDRLAKAGRSNRIDTDRICLSGGSAGGYLALIAGLEMPDKCSDELVGGYRGEKGIKCIAPFYPITDLTDPFWATETNPVPWWNRSIPHAEAKPHIDLRAAPVCTAKSGGPRSILYPYMLQHALFPSLLFMNQRSLGRGLDGFRPSPEPLSITTRLQLLQKHGKEHLPIYLIYGDRDDKVQPMDKTVEVLRAGKGKMEVEVLQGADHAFDEVEEVECEAFREWLGRTLL